MTQSSDQRTVRIREASDSSSAVLLRYDAIKHLSSTLPLNQKGAGRASSPERHPSDVDARLLVSHIGEVSRTTPRIARPTDVYTFIESPIFHQIGSRNQPFERSTTIHLLSTTLCYHLHRIHRTLPSHGRRPATNPQPRKWIPLSSFRVWHSDLRIIPGTNDPLLSCNWDIGHQYCSDFGLYNVLLALREESVHLCVTAWQRTKEGFSERGSALFTKSYQLAGIDLPRNYWNAYPIEPALKIL